MGMASTQTSNPDHQKDLKDVACQCYSLQCRDTACKSARLAFGRRRDFSLPLAQWEPGIGSKKREQKTLI